MSDSHPTVSIVLLSYNRPALLRDALDSIVAQTHEPLDVIVVDNQSASSDEVERVVRRFPSARLIRNRENLGFAAGMNRGIAQASGEFVYLTEDDIVLDRDCLRRLVAHAREDKCFGLLSPILYNRAGGTIRCAGGEVSLGGVYRRKTFGEGQRDAGQFARAFEVTYVDGAVVFARTEFLRGLGGFREEFFMYVEAVEFCVRVAKAGATMTVVPRAKVYHAEPPLGTNMSPELEFHRYKNLFSLYLLHAPARCLPEFFCRYALLALVRALFGSGDVRALLKAIWWVSRRTPSLLGERRRAAHATVETKDACAGVRVGGQVFDEESESRMKV